MIPDNFPISITNNFKTFFMNYYFKQKTDKLKSLLTELCDILKLYTKHYYNDDDYIKLISYGSLYLIDRDPVHISIENISADIHFSKYIDNFSNFRLYLYKEPLHTKIFLHISTDYKYDYKSVYDRIHNIITEFICYEYQYINSCNAVSKYLDKISPSINTFSDFNHHFLDISKETIYNWVFENTLSFEGDKYYYRINSYNNMIYLYNPKFDELVIDDVNLNTRIKERLYNFSITYLLPIIINKAKLENDNIFDILKKKIISAIKLVYEKDFNLFEKYKLFLPTNYKLTLINGLTSSKMDIFPRLRHKIILPYINDFTFSINAMDYHTIRSLNENYNNNCTILQSLETGFKKDIRMLIYECKTLEELVLLFPAIKLYKHRKSLKQFYII